MNERGEIIDRLYLEGKISYEEACVLDDTGGYSYSIITDKNQIRYTTIT